MRFSGHISRGPISAGCVAAAVALLVGVSALAGVPPWKVAVARQASLRSEGGAPKKVDLSVTVTAGKLASYAASGVALGGGEPLSLSATGADGKLALGAGQAFPWTVVFALLSSTDPLTAVQRQIGQVDAGQTRIEPGDDEFVYVFGDSPRISLSRDLSHIRQITAQSGQTTWEFRLTGELGVAGLPERIAILRAGQPYANLRLAVAEPQGKSTDD